MRIKASKYTPAYKYNNKVLYKRLLEELQMGSGQKLPGKIRKPLQRRECFLFHLEKCVGFSRQSRNSVRKRKIQEKRAWK